MDIQVVSPFLYLYPSPLDKRLSFLLEKVIILFKGGHHNTHCATPSPCPVFQEPVCSKQIFRWKLRGRKVSVEGFGVLTCQREGKQKGPSRVSVNAV